ncbi:Apolipoprotein D [Eumeta japonica]|uniref:Apolipoprotein D n=1 Tax=Eumeta variegata TaxID=151549 RepID=A0A4C1XRR8_EUMVA|nr:Apolipoprotein D [Eumeta japonica]
MEWKRDIDASQAERLGRSCLSIVPRSRSHDRLRRTGLPSTSYGLILPSGGIAPSSFRYVARPRMPQLLTRLLPGSGRYRVLYVDYDAAALIYTCSSINIAHSDKMWILGRSREISAELRAHIYNLMLELQLDPDRLIISQTYNCQDNA